MPFDLTHDWHSVQLRLKALGFDPGAIDGIRGPRTDAAIVAFKKSIGFRARPYFGPLTQAALFERQPKPKVPNTPSIPMPWYDEAMRVKGLHEARNTTALREWFDRSVSWIDPREIPWCGAFVATAFRLWNPTITLPNNPLGARNWGAFGDPCEPQLGACLVFWRGSRSGWKGHVGFYAGEDDAHYHVLGGNQSNAVTITRIAKDRLLHARWPSGAAIPKHPRVIRLTAGGVPISTNEA